MSLCNGCINYGECLVHNLRLKVSKCLEVSQEPFWCCFRLRIVRLTSSFGDRWTIHMTLGFSGRQPQTRMDDGRPCREGPIGGSFHISSKTNPLTSPALSFFSQCMLILFSQRVLRESFFHVWHLSNQVFMILQKFSICYNLLYVKIWPKILMPKNMKNMF